MAQDKTLLEVELVACENGVHSGIRPLGGEWEDTAAEMSKDLAGVGTRIQLAEAASTILQVASLLEQFTINKWFKVVAIGATLAVDALAVHERDWLPLDLARRL